MSFLSQALLTNWTFRWYIVLEIVVPRTDISFTSPLQLRMVEQFQLELWNIIQPFCVNLIPENCQSSPSKMWLALLNTQRERLQAAVSGWTELLVVLECRLLVEHTCKIKLWFNVIHFPYLMLTKECQSVTRKFVFHFRFSVMYKKNFYFAIKVIWIRRCIRILCNSISFSFNPEFYILSQFNLLWICNTRKILLDKAMTSKRTRRVGHVTCM